VCISDVVVFFFKQKTAYEIVDCDWSSDVCSSDLSRDDLLEMGGVILDRLRRVAARMDGSNIDFTPAEFSLVWALAQADGKVQSRNDLVDAMSTGHGPVNFRAVDILVSRVRKKLGNKSAVQTVPHMGYKCGWAVNSVEGNT